MRRNSRPLLHRVASPMALQGLQSHLFRYVRHNLRLPHMSQLSGEIHIDGAYVNGHIRPRNKKENRIDRRLAENQRADKRCVFVMRQKYEEIAAGAIKTLTFVIKSENQADVNNLTNTFVKKGSIIARRKIASGVSRHFAIRRKLAKSDLAMPSDSLRLLKSDSLPAKPLPTPRRNR